MRFRSWQFQLSVSFVLTVTLAVALALFGSGCKSAGLSAGSKAPDFILQTAEGGVGKLSNVRGQPVLLNLWATWCAPCLIELPVLERIAADYKDAGLVVWAVAGDEDVQSVHSFLAKNPLKFDVLLDPDGSVGTQYEITGYPETFLIDREGKIRDKFVGPLPSQGGRPGPEFAARLDALVAD